MKIAHTLDARSGRTEGRLDLPSLDSVGEVLRRAKQRHEVLSDGNTRRTDGDLQKLGLSDTTKHLLDGEGSQPASHLDPSQYAVNERHTGSCSRCDTILMRPGVPRIFAAITWKREASGVEKAKCDIKTR